ncbi:MAG: hypothetical protein HY886_01130 [Deltaproteobacteria bacterium]|nr:hypothetical protein [Deltaproteobacteria bacterium]
MLRSMSIALATIFLAITAVFYVSQDSLAAPTFARQTGMACNTCHFQHFPTLNAFGRAFKSGGYTMAGGQSLLEGDLLSMPSSLNASLVTKIRYQKRNGDSGNAGASTSNQEMNKGTLQFPDEAALLIGGRAGEHIGFLLEASLKDSATTGTTMFTSYKMPVVFDAAGTKLSVIPFTTDAAGPSYGFEILNTGAVRMLRPLEHRNDTSAQQYVGTDGAATGFAFVAAHNLVHANYTAWYPAHGDSDAGPYMGYFRAAITPTIAGWDIAAGTQVWRGSSKSGGETAPTRVAGRAFALDAQAQGTAGKLPLGAYLTYTRAPKSKPTCTTCTDSNTNMYNTSLNKTKSAWTATAEAGVIPNRVTLAASYRNGKDGDPDGDNKDGDNAKMLGAVYTIAQNLQLQLNNSWFSGSAKTGSMRANGNMLTTVMLFGAF